MGSLPIKRGLVTDARKTGHRFKNYLFLVAVDSTSDVSWIVFLDGKTIKNLKEALKIILNKIVSDGYSTSKIRCDGEKGIFAPETIDMLRDSYSIEVDLTCSSQQNLAEAKIKALRSKAKHMMKHRFLSVDYIHSAFRYANHLLLLAPKTRLGGRTSYQEWYGRSPARSINRCRDFGSVVYFHKKHVTRHKHDSTRELIFVGFEGIDGPYLAVDPKTQGFKTIASWHAIFNESPVAGDWLSKITTGRLHAVPTWPPEPTSITIEGVEERKEEEEDEAIEEKAPEAPPLRETAPPKTPIRKSMRSNIGQSAKRLSPNMGPGQSYENESEQPPTQQAESQAPSYYISGAFLAIGSFLSSSMISEEEDEERHCTLFRDKYPKAVDIKEPKTIKQAKNSPYWKEWEKSTQLELQNLDKHDTFKIEDRKRHQKTIGTKWVFKVKHDKNGNVKQFKARLVAKGYNQTYLEHYDKTFAPVAYLSSILMILVLAVQLGLSLHLLDFQGAFLHSLMPEKFPVYIDTPHGFDVPPNKIIKLHKSLYGTKNAGHLWWSDLRKALIAQGYTQCIHDQCIFYKIESDGTVTYLATWVDDVIVASNSTKITSLKEVLERKGFAITTFEKLEWYLGLNITQNEDGSITIDQSAYIDNMLATFDMKEAHVCSTPIAPGDLLPVDVDSPALDSATPYRSLIGALSHIARFTRPDILYATFYFARFQKDPTQAHWKGAKRILRYLKHTRDLKTHVRKPENDQLVLEAFCDADWGKKESKYKSTSGYTILLNKTPILSVSRKQKATAQSTCESELYAAGVATMDIIWVRNLLKELVPQQKLPPTPLLCDNQAVLDNVRGDKNSKRLKHCMLKLTLLREHESKAINMQKIHTKENVADIFTKPLHRGPFEHLREALLTAG